MSHIETRKVKIENFDSKYVEEAINLMAKNHDFEVVQGVNEVTSMDRTKAKADIVLKHKKDNYAIGVNYKKGKLELVGEFWNNRGAAAKIEEWTNSYYTAVVYGNSMVESGEYNEFSYDWDAKNQEVIVEGIKSFDD